MTLGRDLLVRHVYDAKPASHLGFSETGFR